MEFESAQSNTTAKLPILKLGEYEMWVIRIKQYFQVQDYALWEVIENGNSWVSVPQTSQENGTSVTKMSVPVTAEEKTNKKNDVKARSLLLMALPNEHQLTFSQYSDAKTMIQKLVSRLAILGVIITPEDLNSKFLKSLPPEWNTHVVVWMNKADIETMSIDDLYNNFKIVKQDVKKTVGASTGTQNMAFMTAPSTSKYETRSFNNRIRKKITINGSDTAGYDKSKVECFNCHKMGHFARECRSARNQESRPRNHDNWNRNQGSSTKTVNVEETSSKAMLAIDGVGFDWSDMAEEQYDDLIVKLNQTEFIASTYKRGLTTVEEQLVTFRKNEVLFSEEIRVLKREVACKDYEIGVLKTEFEKVKQEKEGIDFKIAKFEPEFNGYGPRDTILKSTFVFEENIDNTLLKEQVSIYENSSVSVDENSFVESPLNVDKETVCHTAKKVEFVKPKNNEKLVRKSVSFDHLQINCPHHQRKRRVTGNNYNRVDYDNYAKTLHPSSHRNMTPRAVLLKSALKPLSTGRPIYLAHPKQTVHSARPMTHFSNQAQSTIQRPFYKKATLTNRYFNQKVNTVRPRVVNIASPYTTQVNTVRAKGVNDVKPSACWFWRPTIPNGASLIFNRYNYIDARGRSNRCSRHMTGNIAYLSYFKEFDGGYVTFMGGAYGGRITGQCTLKTDSLDFEDVHFVNELKFNLFSVSQTCDKKNYVIFTDTECLVLSPNFKLPNESQILLKIPREDFDMKNIVPKESLTCLVTKATSDESMLWHRRLGHINFKNINKLVKENLVKGLPLKCFENDQTYVACLKGKRHRASCKSKVLNPITKPLFMLHMDLFGPTFVSSLMHKKYCLVVTDDYSRFTWVFFLATKDETSEILKNFIKEIENLVDKKVKIIRCDNGTGFKNKVMDDFCREKGIRREYSVARTPQQNRVAERRNRTLIEAARTMVLIVKPHNKTPYELFRGKFDGKSDEGFFVGYFLSSKAFRVYNTRTKKVEENLNIEFLEDKPIIEGNGPKWLFDIDKFAN
ncbi:putative ribonuclease H-like domain-containing protein [Tanacetum coccineum]